MCYPGGALETLASGQIAPMGIALDDLQDGRVDLGDVVDADRERPTPVTPGEILADELEELDVTGAELARSLADFKRNYYPVGFGRQYAAAAASPEMSRSISALGISRRRPTLTPRSLPSRSCA